MFRVPSLGRRGRRTSRWLAALTSTSLGLVLLLALAPIVSAQDGATGSTAASNSSAAPAGFSEEGVRTLLAATKEALAATSADAAEDSPEGQRRLFLTRRQTLANEFLSLVERNKALAQRRAGFESRLQEATSELAQLEKAPEPKAPASPDKAGFEKLGETIATARQDLTRLRDRLREGQASTKGLASALADADARGGEATRRAESLSELLQAEGEEGPRRILQARIENARLDREVAQRSAATAREEADVNQAAVPVLSKEIRAAEARVERLEAEFDAYGKALEADLAKANQALEAELADDQRLAREAETPQARLLASWRARIGLSKTLRGEAEARLLNLRKEVSDQRKRLAAEQDDLASLRELLAQSAGSRRASARIQTVFRLLDRRRVSLDQTSRSGFEAELEAHRARRFEIEDLLIDLSERSREELDAVLAQVPEDQRSKLRDQAEDLLLETQAALRDERGVLTEAITEGQNIQSVLTKRYSVLAETHRFIRSEAFWLRDAAFLPVAVHQHLTSELGRLHSWGLRARASLAQGSPATWAVEALVFLLVLPALVLGARRRLVALAQSEGDDPPQLGAVRRLGQIAAGLLGATLLPAYLWTLAAGVQATGAAQALPAVLSAGLDHVAMALFLILVTGALFQSKGIARRHFDLHPEAASTLLRAGRTLGFGFGVLLLPWALLIAPTLELVALPRVAYTAFELLAAATLLWALRAGSGLFLAADVDGWRRHRGKLSWALGGLAVVIVLLDVAGYRYSARQLGTSLVETLLVALVLPGVYLLVQRGLAAAGRRMRVAARRAAEQAAREVDTENAPEGAQPSIDVEAEEAEAVRRLERIQGAVRMVFTVAGVLLVARCWGIDEGFLEALARVPVFSSVTAAGVEDVVTAADCLQGMVLVGLTLGLNYYLPAICNGLIFPRLGLDQGLNYAILSLLRYSLIVIGAAIGLSAIHVDLASLGWLMGALSVGLGFGLQEIVSNFVCGLILLIERPVRVGDVISVGGKTGTVTKINIRATTILNFDRQEEILPNRSFITGDVTNWTRGDTINRVVVTIGVAYGSDVDVVSDLLLRLAKENSQVLADPAPSVVFVDHGDSALIFNLRVFVPSPNQLMTTRDALNKAINKALAAEGIEIPFPQRDLHIRSSDVPLFLGPE